MYHFCTTLPESNEGYRFPFRNRNGSNDLLKCDLIKMKTAKTDADIDLLYILNSAESQQPTKHEKYFDKSFEAASVKKGKFACSRFKPPKASHNKPSQMALFDWHPVKMIYEVVFCFTFSDEVD